MKKEYIVRQNDYKDCGVCCLESIFKYYDGYIPIETLRIDTNTNLNGTTAYNLIKTARKYGLNGQGRKIKELNSEDILLPAIAHLKLKNGLEHFVVIYKISKKHIYIMDPAKGYIKYHKNDFYNIWNNIILEFIPYQKIPSIKKNKTTINLLLETLIKEKYLFLRLTIYNIFLIIFTILTSYYFKIMTSNIDNNYITISIFIIIIFLFINIIKIFMSYIKNEYEIYLEKNIDLSLIIDLISHIFKLPLDVIKSRTSGEILTRVNEFNNIKTVFIEIVSTIIPDLLLSLISIYFLYTTSNELFLILCIISLLYIITGTITTPIIYKKINDNIDLETEFNSNLSEKINGIESIKNLNKTKYFLNNINKNYLLFKSNDLSYKKHINFILLIKQYIYELGTFIITSIGFILIIKNKLTLINLITFNTLLTYFINPILNTINLLPNLYYIKLLMIKSTEFYQAIEEKEENEYFENGDIKLENIEFSYNDFSSFIKNLNISIYKNNHIHFVGKSGSGKSTICKLITRHIDDYEGNIYIGNKNIKDYSKSTIRNNLTYVSQREVLFTDTLLNNIILNNKISNKELNKIFKLTGVQNIIDNKELKLETYLFDGGFNLSGGERQRIILARALVQKPKILILDESLSELDKKSEISILKQLDKYYKDTTIIYISHSQTRVFNKIIEIGT